MARPLAHRMVHKGDRPGGGSAWVCLFCPPAAARSPPPWPMPPPRSTQRGADHPAARRLVSVMAAIAPTDGR
jgi:hypothetical protein